MNLIRISEFSDANLDMYARLRESQLYHYFEPAEGVFIAESPMIIERALDAGYEPLSILMEESYVEEKGAKLLQRCGEIPIYVAKHSVLIQLTGYEITRGMLGAFRRKKRLSVPEVCENASRIVILENVMNPTNVGAIFRSAAALGMDGILLSEGCADPLYRRASRVSMGTTFQIPWASFDKECPWSVDTLHKLGYKLVAMALTEDSISISNPALQAEEKLAIVMGTEGEGLAKKTIEDCDYTVMIPMSHGVDSLNVAAASAVAFWELSKRE